MVKGGFLVVVIVNFPSASEVAPALSPFMVMFAPGIGPLLGSFTEP
jgi:hypothetical protein